MKNKVYESFDKAIEDVFDGAAIAASIFGPASQPLNLWEALSRKDVRDLTIITNMSHPRQPAPAGPHLPTYGPINCILQPGHPEATTSQPVLAILSSFRFNTLSEVS